MEKKEFDSKIHREAVEFRNKKRALYLKGLIPEEQKFIVESWDIGIPEKGIPFWKTRDLTEEPLSLDVFNKFLEKKNGV